MSANPFLELGLSEKLVNSLSSLGFEEPTPIQTKAIPVLLEGRDVLGQAATGTGKTAAFSLPLIQRYCLDTEPGKPQVLILTPTRELCIQVSEAINSFARSSGVYVLPVYGGQDYSRQIKALSRGVQIVVATPGRALDHIRRGTLNLTEIKAVVLDEADEMLDMGFAEDLEAIFAALPEKRQTALFSATLPPKIAKIAENHLHDAFHILIPKEKVPEGEQPKVKQSAYIVGRNHKTAALGRILDIESPRLAIVFARTRNEVDELAESLRGRGYSVEPLHGGLDQAQRDRVMKRARAEQVDVIVATDVAARGIDVDDVEAVFNYDLPQDEEYYVHRIGRTGRAGRGGHAFSFVSGKEMYKLKEIQRYCKTKIYAQKVPSINDVANTKMEHILAKADSVIERENLSLMLDAIEERVNASDYTTMDMAAALLKMYMGMVKEETEEEEITDFGDTGAEEPGMVRLFINIGKKQKIRPGDILGAIAGESGMPGKLIGTIDMFDKYTFVEVPREYASEVLKAMKSATIKGNHIAIEPANRK